MMRFKEDEILYKRNYMISMIISLVICISGFVLFPKLKVEMKKVPYFPEPVITVLDIPLTQQTIQSPPPLPSAPSISSLLEPINEPEPLPDVKIYEAAVDFEEEKNESGKIVNIKTPGVFETSSLPFIPRQILEVVPQVERAIGLVKLRVLVGIDGFVKSHKIISNTTNSVNILQNVTDAVYKSRWQPISIEGEKVEYWIEKTYTFN